MSAEQVERNAPPSVLVLFGASGDLTRRKLVPALESLARAKRLPNEFAVVGVGRTPMSDEEFRAKVLADGRSVAPELTAGYRYISGGYDDPETYKRLAALLEELDEPRGTGGNRLFYLSTPVGGVRSDRHRPRRGRPDPDPGGRRPGRDREAVRDGRAHGRAARRDRAPALRGVARSSGSTTTWARTPSRTSWRCASPTRCSSRSGTAPGSTTCRSPWPRRSGSAPAAASTRAPARSATSCRTTCCRCWRWR